jgi:tRNA-modifying protein YgfZ
MTEYPEPENSWRALRDRAIFRITGPDRVRYLNGQVTNDVSGPLQDQAIAACLCTIKGKVEALVWISSDGDGLLLDGEISQREAIHARLERYLIADDCEISDVTDELTLFHHFIADAPGIPSKRTRVSGKDLFLPMQETSAFEAKTEIQEDQWNQLQTVAAIPRAGDEITGAEFPAELGIERMAVSFHKGCYLGQEIISRIESVGRVKRRLRLLETPEFLSKGTQTINSLQESGTVTRESIFASEKKWITLGFFQLKKS